jgi:hypothetical protein
MGGGGDLDVAMDAGVGAPGDGYEYGGGGYGRGYDGYGDDEEGVGGSVRRRGQAGGRWFGKKPVIA